MKYRLLTLALLALGGCAPMRLAVPEPLAPAPEWRVQTRGWRSDRMRFGPYEAHRIDFRERQRGGILDAISGKREWQQEYTFLLRDTTAAADLWAVRCDHRDVERGVSVRGVRLQLDDRASLECALNPPGDPSDPWTLRLGRSGDRMPRGELHRGESEYSVRGESAGDGCCEPTGYELWKGDALLGMVDRYDRGTVRITPSLPAAETGLLAAVSAALLIQR
jgi:hypothetical protein